MSVSLSMNRKLEQNSSVERCPQRPSSATALPLNQKLQHATGGIVQKGHLNTDSHVVVFAHLHSKDIYPTHTLALQWHSCMPFLCVLTSVPWNRSWHQSLLLGAAGSSEGSSGPPRLQAGRHQSLCSSSQVMPPPCAALLWTLIVKYCCFHSVTKSSLQINAWYSYWMY